MIVEDQEIPTHQGLAMILMCVGVLLPATVYWQGSGETLLGAHSLIKLMAVTGAFGAIALAVFAGLRGWRRALIRGALAGAGASGLQVVYVTFLERSTYYNAEVVLVSFLGAAPGLILYALTRPSQT